jgi:hypothetical protein
MANKSTEAKDQTSHYSLVKLFGVVIELTNSAVLTIRPRMNKSKTGLKVLCFLLILRIDACGLWPLS